MSLPPETAPRRYGDYVLLESLGRGGMSAVDLARRSVDSANYVRFLVIKRILRKNHHDPTFLRMFIDEARINAELQHENIAQVYDFGENGGEWYLAMEYVPGIDLRQIQRTLSKQESGRLIPPRIALRILHDVLSALAYAHDRVDTYGQPMRIVHRDVNPRNIMISVRGEVKLIDFGVAKADTRHDQTTGQAIKGKFAYMAPEQIESELPVDGRADLFAMGLLLQELLTGTHPFRHLNEVQIIHRLMADRIDPMPDAPAPLDPVVVREVRDRVLSAKPEQRHPDARALQADLMRLAAPLGGLASRAEVAEFFRGAAPEAADRIAQRLHHWKDSRPPPRPLKPELIEDPDSIGLPDDTWASDARTHEVPKDWADGSDSILASPDPANNTIADQRPASDPEESIHGDASSVAGPDPTPPPQGISLAAALGLGGGLGLLFIGLLAIAVLVFVQASSTSAVHEAPLDAPAVDQDAPVPQRPDSPAPEPAPAPDAAPEAAPTPTPAPDTRRKPKTAPRASSEPKSPAPKTPPPKAPPSPTPPPEANPTEAAEDAPPSAPDPSPPAAAETGFLFATSRPKGLEVWVSGKKLGVTPLANVPLSVGTHKIIFRDPVSGQTDERVVQIVANQPAKASVSQN